MRDVAIAIRGAACALEEDMKFRKKPVVIEAIQFDGENYHDCTAFMGFPNPFHTDISRDVIFIETLEGTHEARKGDFIIKGVNGEFYPCKPDIFAKIYEEAE